MSTNQMAGDFYLSRSILVVEDEKVNREILGKILDGKYQCEYAVNGKEAVRLLMAYSRRYSLILLDLIMPEMDGFEVLKVIREDSTLKKIPVIVLTSEKSAEVKSLQMGASDFIPKPYDLPEVILARVKRAIELSENKDMISATQCDQLTGLFTREFFLEYVLLHDKSYPYVGMDAIVLNINRFHLINEMYGREFGDKMLQKVANRIRSVTQKQHGVASRVDADTFLVYIPHSVKPKELLNEVIAGVSDYLDNPGVRFRMGVYANVSATLEVNRRFDRAHFACNSIRRDYAKHIAFYDEFMQEKEAYNERLINDMGRGLADKEFTIYYQPKYNIKGAEPVLTSAEALVRWNHPEIGEISPDNFIPLFEENGLVHALDQFVWREAARQIAAWKEKFKKTIPVSVNVSRIDIMENDFVGKICAIADDAGIEYADLLLEVTESAYTDNANTIIRIVTELREKGFKVEMDDFGSGYSSLNMLASLPLDALKLDMGFVQHIHTNERDYGMIELVMNIAKFLEVPVIAEGVENKEQFELLKKAGADIIQGFYFSKPVLPEEFEAFI